MVRASKWLICLMAMKLVTMKPVLKKIIVAGAGEETCLRLVRRVQRWPLRGFSFETTVCSRLRTDWWGKCCQERRTCLWDQTFVFRNRTQQWPDCQRRDSLRRFFVSYIVAFQHISFMEVKENGMVWIGLVLSFRLIRPKTYPLEEKSMGRVDQKYTSKAWAIKKFFSEKVNSLKQEPYMQAVCVKHFIVRILLYPGSPLSDTATFCHQISAHPPNIYYHYYYSKSKKHFYPWPKIHT